MRLHPSWPYRSPERRVSKPPGSPLRPPSSPRYAGSTLRPPSCALRRASCQPSHSPENQGSLRQNPTSGPYEDMQCTPWFAPFSHRDHVSLIPACFSMLFKVPTGMSLFGCGTVTRPFFVGCLNCLLLPPDSLRTNHPAST